MSTNNKVSIVVGFYAYLALFESASDFGDEDQQELCKKLLSIKGYPESQVRITIEEIEEE